MRPVRLLPLLAMAVATASAQEPVRLTLEQAQELALKKNPAINAAQYSASAALQQPRQIASARYPVLTGNFSGAGAPENTRLAAGAINNPVIYSRLGTGLTMSQLLFDFGRTSHLVESSNSKAQAEQESANFTRSQILMDTARQFFSALRAEAVLQVASETVAARQLVVDQVTELQKARLKSGLDVSFARVSLEEAKLLLSSAKNGRQAAYANLAAVLGYQGSPQFHLIEENSKIEPLSLQPLIDEALKNRADLKGRQLQMQSANSFVRAEHSLRMPSVSAVASAGIIPARVDGLRSNYSAVGLMLNLPLMNGGLNKSREEEARLRAQAEEQRVRDLENRIVRDVTVALLDVNTAAERVELSHNLLDQASQALELAKARYDLGLSSIVELSQAQLAQTSAAIQNADARYEYEIQRAVLNYQTGHR